MAVWWPGLKICSRAALPVRAGVFCGMPLLSGAAGRGA